MSAFVCYIPFILTTHIVLLATSYVFVLREALTSV
jgi:hypothetical protein